MNDEDKLLLAIIAISAIGAIIIICTALRLESNLKIECLHAANGNTLAITECMR